jgi:hypothetical protein
MGAISIRKLTLAYVLLICSSILSFSQEFYLAQDNKSSTTVSLPKSRIYKTWVSLNSYKGQIKGVLFEIRDSSVLLSNSLVKEDYQSGNIKVTNIWFNDIDHISVRKKNKILNSTLIGSAAGLATEIIAAYSVTNNKDESAFLALVYSLPSIVFGAGIGALIGSFRFHIPVKGSFEYFKGNQNRLEKFSYIRETSDGIKIYNNQSEHKCFAGLTFGPSFPSGKFASDSVASTNESFPKTGGYGSLLLGIYIKRDLGLSINYFNSSYNITNSASANYWSFSSILAGPVFSHHFKEYFFLDMKPMIGYVFVNKYVNNISESSGNGLAIFPAVSLRYNFSKRWCMLTESGLLLSNPEYSDSKKSTNAFNIGLGIAYRFR